MVVIFQGNTGDANAVNHINTPVTMKPVVTENSPSSPGISPLGIRRIRWGGGGERNWRRRRISETPKWFLNFRVTVQNSINVNGFILISSLFHSFNIYTVNNLSIGWKWIWDKRAIDTYVVFTECTLLGQFRYRQGLFYIETDQTR